MNCDEYYSYNALAGLVKSGEEEVVKHDPWELVTEAVTRMKRNGDVMRADRLKQVMQQIDSSFDEKNVGKAKFSLFVTEAAKRGLVSLNKLENGQLEVDLPNAAPAAQTEAAPVVVTPAAASAPVAEEDDRSRRGKGRGRDRGRREREPKPEAKAAAPADKAPVEAKQPEQPQAEKGERDAIGVQGLRLTRDEAFDLVKRAVDAAATGNKAAPASRIRAKARELLGRDSESLSERNFLRILHDAHDADVIDLRKRGSDYEVAKAVAAPPVERQLETAAIKNAPIPPAVTPTPRGMGARGIGRPGSGKGAPPPGLLNVGVVALPSAAPVSAPTNTAKAPEDSDAVAVAAIAADATAAPAKGRKRGGAKKTARKKTEAAPAGAPAAKRGGRKKTAAT
jgi:hypothetical protein